MATLNALYNEATWSTENWFSKKVVDNIFTSNPMAMRLRQNARTLNGGENLNMSMIFDKGDGEWFSEWDTYSATHKEQLGAGQLDWKLYTVPVVLSHLQLLKNSASEERRFDLAAQKNIVAAKTASDDLGTAIFSLDYTATKQINSLDHAVNDGTGSGLETGFSATYAGISRAAAPGSTVWVSTVDDANTNLSLPVLQSLWGNAQEGDERPNLNVTTQANFNRYYDLLTPIQRLGSDEMGKAGFLSLLFNGAPVVVDSHVNSVAGGSSADYWYMFNMNHIELVAHRMAFFNFERAVMPVNQWVHIGRYYFVGNVLCHAPRYQAKLTAITA